MRKLLLHIVAAAVIGGFAFPAFVQASPQDAMASACKKHKKKHHPKKKTPHAKEPASNI